ncbi:MAG: hypothetical protein ACXVZX_05500 [Terriglobales bacterium]
MASITIDDLPRNQALDAKAMSSIRGGGAPWVYGWITPYDPEARNPLPVLNFYQVNNSFYAEQMINQFQTVQVNNTAPGSNISVALDERSKNIKQ